MALRLGISSSMLPNFRGRLCLQRPSSSTTLCRNPVCVQFLSGSVPGCQKCLLRGAPRRPASRAPVSAADGEWDANSFHCRSCGDAHDLGTSGSKHEDWVRSARGQGLEDGRQDVSRDSSVLFVGVERLYRFQTGSSSTSHRSHFFAAPSSSRLNNACAEQSCGLRGEMKVQEISESQVLSRTPLSCNCFCDSDRGMASGAGSWGMRKLPIFHCHVSARFSPMSVGSWPSVPSNFSRANSLQCKRMSGSASSHLTSPTADHPSCAAPDSSKGLAPAGLLSVGSQEVQIWDHEHPGDACTREDEQESDLRSESMSLRAEDFLGLNGSTLHEGMAFAVDDHSDGSIQHAENTRTGPTQFVVGEEVTDAESQMETAVMKALEHSLGSPLGRESQVPPSKPLVIVISGPSGVGKDVVIKKLQEQRNGIHFVVTATTRPQRPGEVDGHDYFFVSKEKFQSMIDTGELLEHAVVYGDFKGIPKQQVRDCMAKGTDVVLRVDVQGAATVRSILGSNAVFIFLVAESEASLVKRLITRKTETLDKVVLRVATAREELKRLDEFDYAVVNADGQVDRTVSSICSIIDAEKSRVQQRTAVV